LTRSLVVEKGKGNPKLLAILSMMLFDDEGRRIVKVDGSDLRLKIFNLSLPKIEHQNMLQHHYLSPSE
jgi:hypothetical protein